MNSTLRSEMPTRGSARALLLMLTAGLVVFVVLNLLQSRKIQTLTAAESARVVGRLLDVGVKVPPIVAKRVGGGQELISYSISKPTVFYVFTPSCRWCARNLDNLQALVQRTHGEYRFIGLSLSNEGLADYIAKNRLDFEVYTDLSEEAKSTYKLRGTPDTILVSPEGRVLANWMGAYVGDRQKQVEEYFHVKLPGLRDLPPPDHVETQSPQSSPVASH